MKTLFFVALLSLSASASAEIFKCVVPGGDLAYQDSPCDTLSIEQLINLPPTSAGVEIADQETINNFKESTKEKPVEKQLKDDATVASLK